MLVPHAIRCVAPLRSLLLLVLQLVQTIDYFRSFVRSCDTVLVCLPADSRVTSSAAIFHVSLFPSPVLGSFWPCFSRFRAFSQVPESYHRRRCPSIASLEAILASLWVPFGGAWGFPMADPVQHFRLQAATGLRLPSGLLFAASKTRLSRMCLAPPKQPSVPRSLMPHSSPLRIHMATHDTQRASWPHSFTLALRHVVSQ